MKINYKLALAVLFGVLIGVAGAKAIRAQQTKTPPAYFIAEVEVTDPSGMQKYGEKIPETLAPFNHHYVIRAGKTQPLEGDPPKHIIVIAFDNMDKALAWYNSPAYQAIIPIRQKASKARIFLAEGIAPE
jgi:uncharacterized protein (DUF1330 family)